MSARCLVKVIIGLVLIGLVEIPAYASRGVVRLVREQAVLLSATNGESYVRAVQAIRDNIGPGASGALPDLLQMVHSNSPTHWGEDMSWPAGTDQWVCLLSLTAVMEITMEEPEQAVPVITADEPAVRLLVAGMFRDSRDQRVLKPLSMLTTDKDKQVRQPAFWGLGELGEQAVDLLVSRLKSKDAEVRAMAADALGKTKSKRAVKELASVVEDDDHIVRSKAVGALHDIGAPAVNALIGGVKGDNSDVRRLCAKYLGFQKDKRAVEPLLAVLNDHESSVRATVAFALGKFGDPRAVEPLLSTLKDPETEVRARSASALGRIGDNKAFVHLQPLLNDKEGRVRRSAAFAVGKTGGHQAVALLIPLLEDTDWLVRESAAVALGNLGDARAVPSLIALLNEEHFRLQEKARDALAEIGEQSVEQLLKALESEDPKIRKNAAVALGKIGDSRAIEPLFMALKDTDRATWALAKIGQPAIQPLIGALGGEGGEKAASALREIGDPAVEFLIEALKDKDPTVRRHAARPLRYMKDARSVESLIAALKDESEYVRTTSAWALGLIKDPRAVEPLIAALKDKQLVVKGSAKNSLRQITAQDFGDDDEKWQKWWEENKHSFGKEKSK